MLFRRMILALGVVAFATPLHATVAEDKPDITWAPPVAPMLTMGNALLTVVNSVQIADEGSYGLGALGIATGVAGLVVSGQLDERSILVDVPAALSLTTGALSILRQRSIASGRVLISPTHSGRVYGVALNVRF